MSPDEVVGSRDGCPISSQKALLMRIFWGVKEDKANEQHKSMIEALKVAAPEWTLEQINFVAGRCGALVEDDFYDKLERLSVQAGKTDKILAVHVQRICEAHDTVIRSYSQQIHESSVADAMTSIENLGEQVYLGDGKSKAQGRGMG